MKTPIIMIALAASSAAAQVIVGTNSFDVVFEATNLTTVAQARIIDDINICRQYGQTVRFIWISLKQSHTSAIGMSYSNHTLMT